MSWFELAEKAFIFDPNQPIEAPTNKVPSYKILARLYSSWIEISIYELVIGKIREHAIKDSRTQDYERLQSTKSAYEKFKARAKQLCADWVPVGGFYRELFKSYYQTAAKLTKNPEVRESISQIIKNSKLSEKVMAEIQPLCNLDLCAHDPKSDNSQIQEKSMEMETMVSTEKYPNISYAVEGSQIMEKLKSIPESAFKNLVEELEKEFFKNYKDIQIIGNCFLLVLEVKMA